jgi:hypothetical protein
MHFFDLIQSYRLRSRSTSRKACQRDPLLALYGSGKKIWSDEHADERVARLRAGWE